MDKSKVSAMRIAVNEALIKVGEVFNMSIKVGNIKYGDSDITLQVKASSISEDGVVQTQERTDFINLAKSMGLEPEWIDKEFTLRGDTYKIIGLKPRSYKFPILAKDLRSGKTYKISTADVCHQMRQLNPTS